MIFILIIIAVLLLLFIYYSIKCCQEEIEKKNWRRGEKDYAWMEELYERESKRFEEKCANLPIEERIRLRNERDCKLEARRLQLQRELHALRRDRERLQEEKDALSNEFEWLLFQENMKIWNGKKKKHSSSRGKIPNGSHRCGCDCEDCIEDRHYDDDDDDGCDLM